VVVVDVMCNNLTATWTALDVKQTETFIEKNMILAIEQAIPSHQKQHITHFMMLILVKEDIRALL